MGWLRELMLSAERPVKSFGVLARQALAHPGWPSELRLEARSLASVFSKLDREQELDWLRDREPVQAVLASLLGRPLAELRAAAHPLEVAPGQPARLLAWRDVRFARALDLPAEELPPGLPREVLRPERWTPLHWQADSGAGRSLVGRWLEQRGLARWLCPTAPEQLGAALGSSRACFVELPAERLEARWGEALLELGRARPLCVASPAPLPEGFRRVQSEPVATYAEALVEWLAARLPNDGHFHAEPALRWLREGPLAAGLAPDFGAALGWLGLYDELGTREAKGLRSEELAQRWLRERFSELGEAGASDAAWLLREGWELCTELAARAHTDEELPWTAPRSFERWLALVPPEHQRGHDLEWLRHTRALRDDGAQRRELERAARRAPPGAYRIVRALQRAGLLTPPPHPGAPERGELAFGPRWLVVLTRQRALRRLAQAAPVTWGEALLRRHAAPALFDALLWRVRSGAADALEDATELEDEAPLAQVAALEASVRIAGRALMAGEHLARELVLALWEEQQRWLVHFPEELPAPRVNWHPAPTPGLARGAWLAALFALALELPEPRQRELQQLWRAPALGQRLLDEWLTLARADEVLAGELVALVAQLRAAWGPFSHEDAHPHALEYPSALLAELQLGVLTWERLETAGASALDAWLTLARARGLEAELWPAYWQAWLAAPELPEPREPPTWPLAWAALPAELGASVARRGRGEGAWQLTSSSAREAVALALTAGEVPLTPELCAALPEQRLQALVLRADALSPPLLQALWSRSLELGLTLVRACLSAGALGHALALAELAPEAASARLVEGFVEQLPDGSASSQLLLRLQRWLHARIAARDAGYERAHELLDLLLREQRAL